MLRQAYLYLFNRGTGFQSPIIPKYPLFQPFTLPLDQVKLRNILGLNEELTDVYGLAYLSLMNRHPEIALKLLVPHTAFSVSEYERQASKINGATLRITEDGDEGFTETPDELLINFNFTVSYVSNTEVNVFTEHFNRNYRYVDTELAGQRLITVNWDKRIPFRGSVLRDTWAPGDKFTLNYKPRSFPYTTAVKLVAARPEHLQILDQGGFTDNFLVAESDTEKLGWFIAALINTSYELVH